MWGMSQNRQAAAKDRPVTILVIAAITALAGIAQVWSGLTLLFSGEVGSVWQATLDFFVGGLAIVVGLALLQRNRLARLVATVVLLLNIVVTVITVVTTPGGWSWAGAFIGGLLSLAALVLLWTPRANRYFRS